MKKQEKKAYGELKNVMLTDAEYGKLLHKFPDDYEDRINAVSYYKDAKGKEYKSDYAAILMWDNRDKKRTIPQSAKPTAPFTQGSRSGMQIKGTGFSNFKESESDYSEIEKRALNKLMNRRKTQNDF